LNPPSWLWIVLTLLGATGQSLRNATQRSLTAKLGTVGATHIRFLFGLPFGLIALAGVALFYGHIPAPNAAMLAWTVVGAFSQVLATALMLSAMRERSFVVTTAYTKTEPVQVAIFAVLFLGEHLTLSLGLAVIVATAGVLVMSWPSKAGSEAFSWRPALLGIASGGLFALAAVCFRGGITALDTPAFVSAATLTLAVALTTQSVLLSLWLLIRSPEVLYGVLAAWRPSLPAGFLGSAASEMWFLAFALQNPARVRTLGLVEILVAGMIARRMFAQAPTVRDIVGMLLVISGIALLFNG
jgi:drug/metabolite transporter (DMT)-like permease